MNIKHFLSASAAILALAACSDYDPGVASQAVDLTEEEEAFIKNEYAVEFTDRMGTIDENHTWGFPTEGAAAVKTRAVYKNENEWLVRSQELVYPSADSLAINPSAQPWHEYKWTTTYYLPTNAVIPGLPSVIDGKYHATEGVVDDPDDWGTDQCHPTGDVTDEEVAYVSEWFRTHQYPQSETPKFTEYFLQEISQDDDRATYPNGAPIDKALPVYIGGTKKADGTFTGGTLDNGTDPITFGIDYFEVQTSDGNWEHNNDLNKGNATKFNGWEDPTDEEIDLSHRTIKYWKTNTEGTYTTSFRYHNSDNNTNYENYVLVHLSFDGPVSGKHYDGYYIAFDYQFVDEMQADTDENGNTTYKYAQRLADGYYSNWILKLSPADPDWNEPAKKWYRVMCEDLGNSYDFDFNDIVFDVSYEGTEGNYTATVRLQAAGGTLPIYIGAYAPANEAHYMLSRGDAPKRNDGTYKPINVSEGGMQFAEYQPYEFTLQTATDNPDDIDIYVSNVGNKGTRVVKLPKSGTVTKAPMKICIPDVTTRWMRESMQIEETYTYFKYWVQNETSEYNFGQSKAWNKNGIEKAERLW